jgi:prephenate dehydrogenase
MNMHVVGLGLMGSALARTFTSAGHHVTGEDRQRDHVQFAHDHGWIQNTSHDKQTIDILILALPMQSTLEWILTHVTQLESVKLIVDIAGVKGFITSNQNPFIQSTRYVSLHPMTGHPDAGPLASDHVTFINTPMLGVQTSLSAQSETLLSSFISALQCLPIQWMTAEDHDAWIAYASHLPHVLAGVFGTIPIPSLPTAGGTSLKTFQRLASMQPQLWQELLLSNQTHLLPLIEASLKSLTLFKEGLIHHDLTSWFSLIQSQGKKV